MPSQPHSRPKRFLDRLRVQDIGELQRAERVLATARAFLAAASFVAIYLDPTEPTRFAELAYTSLAIYVLYSLLVVGYLRARREAASRISFVLHGVDIVWPTYITLFTEGPNSPFFLYFLFVLLAAAYRWGLKETLATAATAVVLLFAEAGLLVGGLGISSLFVEGQLELNRLIIRATYLLVLGSLVGYLAEQEKQLRAEATVVARVMGKAQVEKGLRGTLQAILEEFREIFDARQVLLVLQEAATGQTFRWGISGQPDGGSAAIRLEEIGPERRQTYFFPAPADAWYANWAKRQKGTAASGLIALDSEGQLVHNISWEAPESFRLEHLLSRAVLVLSLRFRAEWEGRLFLLDPGLRSPRTGELRFAQNLLRRVVPAVYNVYIVRRLRTQAGMLERARVARELHDGVIQSVSAALMRLDLLRRQTGAETPAGEELARIQQILRQEVVNLRELMEQMKPLDLDPRQLLEFLAQTVEKFRRETGINARFISDVEEVAWRPRVCREVARIVQEGLVNVRRHSQAHNVLVRLGTQNGCWNLVIDDDGQGFPFAGRLSHTELDVTRRGPLVIKERVRTIGGELIVDSIPGRGARLEIVIPAPESGT
ncbi:MAG: putative signal transduction histidine kinase [Acidobacteria bacterium]|nr:putative signal transduction histidine kinase [Acidobacteriota bacterium]